MRIYLFPALLAAISLAGCTVVPPSGPSAMVVPSPGGGYGQFTQHDQFCRYYARQQIGGAAGQASSFINSGTVSTTLVGAAAGALIGVAAGNPGKGAAIGAGGGLLLGAASGALTASQSTHRLQAEYNVAYSQCMTANEQAGGSVYQRQSYPYSTGYGQQVYGNVYNDGYDYRPGYADLQARYGGPQYPASAGSWQFAQPYPQPSLRNGAANDQGPGPFPSLQH